MNQLWVNQSDKILKWIRKSLKFILYRWLGCKNNKAINIHRVISYWKMKPHNQNQNTKFKILFDKTLHEYALYAVN
jgi:hypothetical protein